MRFNNSEIEQEIRDNLDELRASSYPEDLLNEWANSAVPVYTNEIVKDWQEMPSIFNDAWQELVPEGLKRGIVQLMALDLSVYYADRYLSIYNEILEEEDN